VTTKVLIVNFGPDPVLVRTVQYEPTPSFEKDHKVIEDMIIDVQGSRVFWVHEFQQLIVGEKRGIADAISAEKEQS
jgi:hypothetical protein